MKKTLLTMALCLIALPACAGVALTETPQPDPIGVPFPKLMVTETNPAREIVFCRAANECTVIKSSNPATVGSHVTALAIADYVDYVGTLTLENVE